MQNIRLSRMTLKPSLSSRLLDFEGVCRASVSRPVEILERAHQPTPIRELLRGRKARERCPAESERCHERFPARSARGPYFTSGCSRRYRRTVLRYSSVCRAICRIDRPCRSYEADKVLWVDDRADLTYYGMFGPKKLGEASAYLTAVADSEGRLFKGDHTYHLRIPADIPTEDFWSITMYSKATKSFIENKLDKSGVSSYESSSLRRNADGSVTITMGPVAPAEGATNWIPSEGEDFFILGRLYGPGEAVKNKSWKMPDVVRIE